MKRIIQTCLIILIGCVGIVLLGAMMPTPERIVTLEMIAPDQQHITVKAIVGGNPVTVTDKTGGACDGQTWAIYVKAIEDR